VSGFSVQVSGFWLLAAGCWQILPIPIASGQKPAASDQKAETQNLEHRDGNSMITIFYYSLIGDM